jgi:hypothetical protein
VLQAELEATNRQVEILSDALAESRKEVAALKSLQKPDYAWPTIADYEKDVGFPVNQAFKSAWAMARTTNDLFTQMKENP